MLPRRCLRALEKERSHTSLKLRAPKMGVLFLTCVSSASIQTKAPPLHFDGASDLARSKKKVSVNSCCNTFIHRGRRGLGRGCQGQSRAAPHPRRPDHHQRAGDLINLGLVKISRRIPEPPGPGLKLQTLGHRFVRDRCEKPLPERNPLDGFRTKSRKSGSPLSFIT